MALNQDLIYQFAKITNDDKTASKSKESIVFGTIVEYEGNKYVQFDGSDLLTPMSSTTNTEPGERVTITIKNHSAIVTGNLSSPAARTTEVEKIGTKVSDFEIVLADKVDTKELNALKANITDLEADNVTIHGELTANKADITDLKAENAEITGKLEATDADIDSLQADNVLIRNELTANNASVENLQAEFAKVDELVADKLSATDADLKYANIDFTNIGKAAMEYFYSNSGLIEDVKVGDATISGNLVGVTISGDLIEGNTIVAEKLVVKGEDGLYYKLNTDGMQTVAEQTDYNSLNGSVIRAKSVTATQISVKDLVAFDATIGGFVITENAIHSTVKETVDNTTRGIYMDNDGQLAIGDSKNYIKFYEDDDGTYKLAISAATMTLGGSGESVEDVLSDVLTSVDATVKDIDVQYYLSTSATIATGGTWSTIAPAWIDGHYMWSRVKTTYTNGTTVYSNKTCIAGATGATGETGATGATGATGVGVKSIVNYYCASANSSGITTGTSGWTTEVQSVTSTNKYLWNYEVVTYTDDTTESTEPCVIGVYGDTGATGATGNGISSITEKYAVSTQNVTAPTTWYDTVQTLSSTNKYLWNYEIITYTNGTTVDTKKRVIGVYGDTGATGETGATGATGATGVGVSSIVEEYYLSTSKESPTDGSWVNEPPGWSSGNYMWFRSKITYSNGVVEYTEEYCDSSWEVANDVAESVDEIQSVTNSNTTRINDAQLDIDTINATISSLVTGQNGESLMTQTDSGWTFSMASILSNLETAMADIDGLNGDVNSANSMIDALNQNVKDLGVYTEYIKFGVENGQPCIILGEVDSNFKVVITNTDIRFMEGTTTPASITNQALNIGTAVVNEELRQGGFAWVARSNGNYGLVWKGE